MMSKVNAGMRNSGVLAASLRCAAAVPLGWHEVMADMPKLNHLLRNVNVRSSGTTPLMGLSLVSAYALEPEGLKKQNRLTS